MPIVGRYIQEYTDPIFRTLSKIGSGEKIIADYDLKMFYLRSQLPKENKKDVVAFFKLFFEKPGVKRGFKTLLDFCEKNQSNQTEILKSAIESIHFLKQGEFEKAALVPPPAKYLETS